MPPSDGADCKGVSNSSTATKSPPSLGTENISPPQPVESGTLSILSADHTAKSKTTTGQEMDEQTLNKEGKDSCREEAVDEVAQQVALLIQMEEDLQNPALGVVETDSSHLGMSPPASKSKLPLATEQNLNITNPEKNLLGTGERTALLCTGGQEDATIVNGHAESLVQHQWAELNERSDPSRMKWRGKDSAVGQTLGVKGSPEAAISRSQQRQLFVSIPKSSKTHGRSNYCTTKKHTQDGYEKMMSLSPVESVSASPMHMSPILPFVSFDETEPLLLDHSRLGEDNLASHLKLPGISGTCKLEDDDVSSFERFTVSALSTPASETLDILLTDSEDTAMVPSTIKCLLMAPENGEEALDPDTRLFCPRRMLHSDEREQGSCLDQEEGKRKKQNESEKKTETLDQVFPCKVDQASSAQESRKEESKKGLQIGDSKQGWRGSPMTVDIEKTSSGGAHFMAPAMSPPVTQSYSWVTECPLTEQVDKLSVSSSSPFSQNYSKSDLLPCTVNRQDSPACDKGPQDIVDGGRSSDPSQCQGKHPSPLPPAAGCMSCAISADGASPCLSPQPLPLSSPPSACSSQFFTPTMTLAPNQPSILTLQSTQAVAPLPPASEKFAAAPPGGSFPAACVCYDSKPVPMSTAPVIIEEMVVEASLCPSLRSPNLIPPNEERQICDSSIDWSSTRPSIALLSIRKPCAMPSGPVLDSSPAPPPLHRASALEHSFNPLNKKALQPLLMQPLHREDILEEVFKDKSIPPSSSCSSSTSSPCMFSLSSLEPLCLSSLPTEDIPTTSEDFHLGLVKPRRQIPQPPSPAGWDNQNLAARTGLSGLSVDSFQMTASSAAILQAVNVFHGCTFSMPFDEGWPSKPSTTVVSRSDMPASVSCPVLATWIVESGPDPFPSSDMYHGTATNESLWDLAPAKEKASDSGYLSDKDYKTATKESLWDPSHGKKGSPSGSLKDKDNETATRESLWDTGHWKEGSASGPLAVKDSETATKESLWDRGHGNGEGSASGSWSGKDHKNITEEFSWDIGHGKDKGSSTECAPFSGNASIVTPAVPNQQEQVNASLGTAAGTKPVHGIAEDVPCGATAIPTGADGHQPMESCQTGLGFTPDFISNQLRQEGVSKGGQHIGEDRDHGTRRHEAEETGKTSAAALAKWQSPRCDEEGANMIRMLEQEAPGICPLSDVERKTCEDVFHKITCHGRSYIYQTEAFNLFAKAGLSTAKFHRAWYTILTSTTVFDFVELHLLYMYLCLLLRSWTIPKRKTQVQGK
ncbi:hypothetical protein CBR_g55339 [Chara braunii]|uniref:Uncharacterized protein n=1 Tax=Chara braunii TaxID=69332 RepID=A0A388MCW0_CHABU|nr:hypothetical protein CBR_g55339 [Chara braunii]|eukprot:GBG92404.1 hypothetical protein CBR_g55339 [Chara braunii]